ncbi:MULTISPECIES: ATP-binding cassette domain-containing protein [Gordonia]|jgi:ABC-2 type transport system ATP-binding protein|nr:MULTISPECIES: ATP-binding cassette domain-containing protein [Gordonia]
MPEAAGLTPDPADTSAFPGDASADGPHSSMNRVARDGDDDLRARGYAPSTTPNLRARRQPSMSPDPVTTTSRGPTHSRRTVPEEARDTSGAHESGGHNGFSGYSSGGQYGSGYDDDQETLRIPITGPAPRRLSGAVAAAPANPARTVHAAATHTPATPARSAIAIEAVNLHKRFKDTLAVDDVTFSVPAGSIVALLGPNGAGKTTTVNMLCTLLKPDGGTALIHGHDVAEEAPAVRRMISLTGQFAALDEGLTGRENLILFGRLLGLRKDEAKSRGADLLEHFGLVEAADKRVREYSGGMRRRIDIACGLVTSPKVVFLDEPTTGLDPRSRQDVWALVEQLKDAGVTTLLTTQYLEEADMLSDNIVVIDRGRVIAEGTSDELKAATGASYCDVTPEHAADLPRLLAILADLLPPGHRQTGLTVVVPAPDGADTLVEVVRRTSESGLRLSDITMRRPSLDEVFLRLTDPDAAGDSDS